MRIEGRANTNKITTNKNKNNKKTMGFLYI